MQVSGLKQLYQRYRVIIDNIKYISILELFATVSPLITYPYLVNTLGVEQYGLVITAQVVASYAVILVNFGFRSISARDVSINRDSKEKLSEIISSILTVRLFIWVVTFIFYSLLLALVGSLSEHYWLFIFSYGYTLNDLLFPQFYFQGIEKMKFITYINLTINIVFIAMIFIVINDSSDYMYVPILRSLGFFIGGVIAIYVIFGLHKIKFAKPSFKTLKKYVRDAAPIFSTEVITSIKDKVSYLLLGSFVGMAEVVVYDLGAKLTNILVKPGLILGRVLFPKISKERNVTLFLRAALGVALITFSIVAIVYLNLDFVVEFFIDEQISTYELKFFLLAPIFLAISSFTASNLIIAFNYNKHILYSIIVTTLFYGLATGAFYILDELNTVFTFILITVGAYFVELLYRIAVSKKIITNRIG